MGMRLGTSMQLKTRGSLLRNVLASKTTLTNMCYHLRHWTQPAHNKLARLYVLTHTEQCQPLPVSIGRWHL